MILYRHVQECSLCGDLYGNIEGKQGYSNSGLYLYNNDVSANKEPIRYTSHTKSQCVEQIRQTCHTRNQFVEQI